MGFLRPVLTLSLFAIAPIAPEQFRIPYGTLDWGKLLHGSWTNYVFASNYLLRDGGGNIMSWGWSVCVEEHFCLLLPLLVWLLFRHARPELRAPVLALGVLLPCAGRLAQARAPLSAGYYFYSHLRFDELFVGVLIAYYHEMHGHLLRAFAQRLRSLLWVTGWLCIGIVWTFGSLQGQSSFHLVFQLSVMSIGAGLFLYPLIPWLGSRTAFILSIPSRSCCSSDFSQPGSRSSPWPPVHWSLLMRW